MESLAQKGMHKVVVYVEGGVVQSVYAPEHTNVAVVDFDNLEAEGFTREEMENMLVITRGTLPHCY